MTTIAYKDGLLAADTRVTARATHSGTWSKITELKNGAILACSGATRFQRWLGRALQELGNFDIEDGMHFDLDCPSEAIAKDEPDCSVMLIRHDGAHFELDGWIAFRLDAPFYAIGSGAQFAMGAMAAGVDARKAVQLASSIDLCSGDGIEEIIFPRSRPNSD
jgi:20S proteasome alpha/beta subunit